MFKKALVELKKNNRLFYIISFFMFLILSILFPYVHDDWGWGSSSGVERLLSFFSCYNGRWAGNLFIIALTRSKLLKVLVMSISLVGIVYFINKINNKSKHSIILTMLLIVLMPRAILRQGVAWTSAFVNYVIPTLLILLFIDSIKNHDKLLNSRNSKLECLLFLILGFITNLFIENLTIYILILSLSLMIYIFVKAKKVNSKILCYFIGNIIGCVLMFSNSAYSSIAAGEDTYRTFGFNSLITTIFKNYFDTIYEHLIYNNIVLNLLVVIFASIVIYKEIKNHNSKKIKFLGHSIIFVLCSFVTYTAVTRFNRVELFLKYTKYFNGLFTFTFCLAILLFTVFFIKRKPYKIKMLFVLTSIIVMTLPLFVVTPIGSRCFFPTYAFLIMYIVCLYEYCIVNHYVEHTELLSEMFGIITVSVFMYLVFIYGYMYRIYNRRVSYINSHLDEKTIVLPKLPYEGYTWLSEPCNDEFLISFKEYYGIPTNTKVTFVSLKNWNKKNNR